MRNSGASMENTVVDTSSLYNVIIYLSGIVKGQGHLDPIGTESLKNLMSAYRYCRGDIGYIAEGDEVRRERAIKNKPIEFKEVPPAQPMTILDFKPKDAIDVVLEGKVPVVVKQEIKNESITSR